jgi:hypothetical protein
MGIKLEVNLIENTQSYENIKQQNLFCSRLAEQFSMSSDFRAICQTNLAAAYLKKQVNFKVSYSGSRIMGSQIIESIG